MNPQGERGPRGQRGQPGLPLGDDLGDGPPLHRAAMDALLGGGLPSPVTREEAEKLMPELTLAIIGRAGRMRRLLRNALSSGRRADELYVRFFQRQIHNSYGSLAEGMQAYAFEECRRVLGL